MSLSVGGCYSGTTMPPSAMGVTSAQEIYTAHYPATQCAGYPDYSTGDRNYFHHNWMYNASPEMPVSPVSYGAPSPTAMCQTPVGYTDHDQHFRQWQDYGVSPEMTLTHGLSAVPDPGYESYTDSFGERCFRRRTSANKKERRRTLSINNAFSNLRGSIPNVPTDTKLSKIKTLRLAISYISYLNEVLEKGDKSLAQSGFKADISRKRERRTDIDVKKAMDSCDSDDSSGSSGSTVQETKSKGRTGWPQHVWASELKSSPQ